MGCYHPLGAQDGLNALQVIAKAHFMVARLVAHLCEQAALAGTGMK